MRTYLPLAILLHAPPTHASEHLNDAATVLATARVAAGPVQQISRAILRAEGHEKSSGLIGRWTSSVDMRSGRYRHVTDFRTFATGLTFDGEFTWKIDASGGVHALNGGFAQRSAVTDGWIARFGYLQPEPDGSRFKYLRHEHGRARSFDVISAIPNGGEPVELWFDDASHLLSRTVRREPTDTATQDYRDYRSVDGIRLPFSMISKDDADDNTDTVSVESYKFGPAETVNEFLRPRASNDTVLVRPASLQTEIGSRIVVEAMLNDQGPFRFILDSGGHDIVTPQIAAELGLKAMGRAQSGGAGAGTLPEQNVNVRSLTLGSARLADQHFYVIPLQYDTVEQGRRAPLAGILGLELFERLAVHIDYRAGVVTLIPFREADRSCSGSRIPIRFDDDIPLVNGSIEGKSGVLAVDTGNSGSTVVQGVWAERVGLADRLRAGTQTTSFGAGGASTNWITRDGTLSIGNVNLSSVYLRLATDHAGSFSSVTEAGNIGQQVLANYAVLLDYSRGVMCLLPVPGYSPPAMDRAGLSLVKRDPDDFEVVSVNAKLPAQSADLRPGDLLVAINGQASSELSDDDVSKIFRLSPGTTVSLIIIRDGSHVFKSLTLADRDGH